MKFVTELQKKPDAVKARYAFGISVCATLFVAILWMSTLPARFDTARKLGMTEGSTSSQSALSDFVSNSKNELGSMIEGIKSFENLDSENKPFEPYQIGEQSGEETSHKESSFDFSITTSENATTTATLSQNNTTASDTSTGTSIQSHEILEKGTTAPSTTQPRAERVILIGTSTVKTRSRE